MSMRVQDQGRTPIAFFHIVDSKSQSLGWFGFCERIGEAMLPAILHPGGIDQAKQRSQDDPPAVIGYYNGDLFVPESWLRKVMQGERDLSVISAMKMAAERAWRVSRGVADTQAAADKPKRSAAPRP